MIIHKDQTHLLNYVNTVPVRLDYVLDSLSDVSVDIYSR